MTTPLLACRACGAETRHEVEFTGLLGAGPVDSLVVSMCEPCFDRAFAEAAVLRGQFEELLAGGMTREQANRVMIARIDGEAPQ